MPKRVETPMKQEKISINQILDAVVEKELQDLRVQNFLTTALEMTELYSNKNHDYGNSFEKGMDTIGMGYGVGRLYDKMNRIITLSKLPAKVEGETMLDTVKDLACYSVMLYNYILLKDINNGNKA